MTSPIRPSTKTCESNGLPPAATHPAVRLFLILLLAATGFIRAEDANQSETVIRLPVAFTAINYSDSQWLNGIDRRDRNRFVVDLAIGQKLPLQTGFCLNFTQSGTARIVDVHRMVDQNRQTFFVRVDRKLDPAGDGFPHPIRLQSPYQETLISLPPLTVRNREHGWLPLLVVLIPLTHFLLAVFLPGLVVAIILEQRWPAKRKRPLDKLWLALACGLLYNTLQFLLVMWIVGRQWLSQPFMAGCKYGMDLTLLASAAVFCKQKMTDDLAAIARSLTSRRNLAVLLLAALVGVMAVLRFPHCFDCGQLIQTNSLFMTGRHNLSGFRISYGFSALVYFPAFNPWIIPMTTIAGGFKLPLMILLGLLCCSAVDRVRLHFPSAVRLLLFAMILSSVYGLYGIVELGKDSVWGVLFSLAAMVMAWRSPQPLAISLLFVAAALMGVIAIPFCLAFLTIWLTWASIPENFSGSALLHWLTIVLPLLGAWLLMPVHLPQFMDPMFNSPLNQAIAYPPADGRTGFIRYFFSWAIFSCHNVPLVIAAGMLGVLLLPAMRRQFASLSLRSLASAVPLTTFFFLLLTLPARGWLPPTKKEHIPWIPLSTFDLWNLIKDMAQWYIAPVCALLVLIVLQAGSRISRRFPKLRPHHVMIMISLPLLASSVSINRIRMFELTKPAHFHTRSGAHDPIIASVFDFITQSSQAKYNVLIDDTLALPHLHDLAWNIDHFYPEIRTQYLRPEMDDRQLLAKKPPVPLLMIIKPNWLPRLRLLYPQAVFRTFCYDERRMIGVFYCAREDGDLLRAEKNRSTTPTKPGSAVFRTNS